MGAGTGFNLEYMNTIKEISPHQKNWKKIYLVDLSSSLLACAKQRIKKNKWDSLVKTCEADVITFSPRNFNSKSEDEEEENENENENENEEEEEEGVDLITFSYSLTMVPDWYLAVEHAWELLKPGGILAIVDFYVGRKYPEEGDMKHGWFMRTFWKVFFAFDNVRLSDDHRGFLFSRKNAHVLHAEEGKASVPYVPFIKAPYYISAVKKKKKIKNK